MNQKNKFLVGIVFLLSVLFCFVLFILIKNQYIAKNNIFKNKKEITKDKNTKQELPKKSEIKWVFNNNILKEKAVIYENKLSKHKIVEDVREYQHGLDIIKRSEGDFVMIWSSSGNALRPVGAREDGEWVHDIYYSLLNKQTEWQSKIKVKKLIKAPLAQEPASSAINKSGNIMVTMEDAWNAKNEVAQTYAVYDNNLKPIKPYQKMILDGGHSGHVASVGDNFAVFYSNGWVDGGGVDNLGSGDDVLLNIYSSNGQLIKKIPVANGSSRDWWPLVAASDNVIFLLWQRFVPGEQYAKLMGAIYDLRQGIFIQKPKILKEHIKYYTYDIQYIEKLNSFLILGSKNDKKGMAILIGERGQMLTELNNIPSLVRESQPAIKMLNHDTINIVYPAMPNRLVALAIKDKNILLEGSLDVGYNWQVAGTDGVFLDDNNVYFASLSPEGIKEMVVSLYRK